MAFRASLLAGDPERPPVTDLACASNPSVSDLEGKGGVVYAKSVVSPALRVASRAEPKAVALPDASPDRDVHRDEPCPVPYREIARASLLEHGRYILGIEAEAVYVGGNDPGVLGPQNLHHAGVCHERFVVGHDLILAPWTAVVQDRPAEDVCLHEGQGNHRGAGCPEHGRRRAVRASCDAADAAARRSATRSGHEGEGDAGHPKENGPAKNVAEKSEAGAGLHDSK